MRPASESVVYSMLSVHLTGSDHLVNRSGGGPHRFVIRRHEGPVAITVIRSRQGPRVIRFAQWLANTRGRSRSGKEHIKEGATQGRSNSRKEQLKEGATQGRSKSREERLREGATQARSNSREEQVKEGVTQDIAL
jgi:hypothetical protein